MENIINEKEFSRIQKTNFVLLATGFLVGDKSISIEEFNNISKISFTDLNLAHEMCVGLMKGKPVKFNV